MLFTEWKLEDALKIEREEGIEEGMEKERRKTIQSLSRFIPVEQIAQMLEIPIEEVNFSLEGQQKEPFLFLYCIIYHKIPPVSLQVSL